MPVNVGTALQRALREIEKTKLDTLWASSVMLNGPTRTASPAK